MEEEKVRKEEAHAENYHPKLIPLSLALAHTAHTYTKHIHKTRSQLHTRADTGRCKQGEIDLLCYNFSLVFYSITLLLKNNCELLPRKGGLENGHRQR